MQRKCPILILNVFKQTYVNDVIVQVWIPSVELKCKAQLVNGQTCMTQIFYLDYVIGLSCQFEMYVSIMCTNNKMVQ